MAAYKDETRGTWYTSFYYQNWTGERKKKLKRGFKTKKEALAWEREFLNKETKSPDMLFASLVELYFDDMKTRVRESTFIHRKGIVLDKILPFFSAIPIKDIKPIHIRTWQNKVMEMDYSETYLRSMNNQLVAVLNYAVKYYDLPENPCSKVGSIGKVSASSMQFWTVDEFNVFLKSIEKKTVHTMAFKLLFWTGIRIGELQALTGEDIDLEKKTLRINKTFNRLNAKDVISDPKTEKSNRIVTLPGFICDDLKVYFDSIFDLTPDKRLFTLSRALYGYTIKTSCEKIGLKKIRVHDLRHSHASLLIELGFSPLLISERLGHEKVETTLETYSHLYPNKQGEVADKLDSIFS